MFIDNEPQNNGASSVGAKYYRVSSHFAPTELGSLGRPLL